MSIQGEMMDMMYLSKLLDALKQSSFGSSNRQENLHPNILQGQKDKNPTDIHESAGGMQ